MSAKSSVPDGGADGVAAGLRWKMWKCVSSSFVGPAQREHRAADQPSAEHARGGEPLRRDLLVHHQIRHGGAEARRDGGEQRPVRPVFTADGVVNRTAGTAPARCSLLPHDGRRSRRRRGELRGGHSRIPRHAIAAPQSLVRGARRRSEIVHLPVTHRVPSAHRRAPYRVARSATRTDAAQIVNGHAPRAAAGDDLGRSPPRRRRGPPHAPRARATRRRRWWRSQGLRRRAADGADRLRPHAPRVHHADGALRVHVATPSAEERCACLLRYNPEAPRPGDGSAAGADRLDHDRVPARGWRPRALDAVAAARCATPLEGGGLPPRIVRRRPLLRRARRRVRALAARAALRLSARRARSCGGRAAETSRRPLFARSAQIIYPKPYLRYGFIRTVPCRRADRR